MNKEVLLQSAGKINALSPKSLKEYQTKRESLVELMNTQMLARPDIQDMVGEANMEMMKDNHANHARFMESLFTEYQPEVFVETVLWVFRAYRSHGFKTNCERYRYNYQILHFIKKLCLSP